MCIIAVKPTGVDMPSTERIKTMFQNNKDGAGFAFNTGGSVIICKGFMKVKHLIKSLNYYDSVYNLKYKTVILHFRIGTTGDNSQSNCHPFPISANLSALEKTKVKCPLAVAHNGIIDITPRNKTISDTMEFIASVISPLAHIDCDFHRNGHAQELIYNVARSKFAFVDSSGHYETIGQFNESTDGILYSNYSYYPYYSYKNWDYWDGYNKDNELVAMMFIEPDDGYIIKRDGTLAEPYDYLISADGKLYQYDFNRDTAIPSYDTALNHNGTGVKYDINRADYFIVDDGKSIR